MSSGSPQGPKPKSAVPPRLLNGSSSLNSNMNSRGARERESLNSSIRSSFAPRIPAEFNLPETVAHSVDESTHVTNESNTDSGAVKYVACTP